MLNFTWNKKRPSISQPNLLLTVGALQLLLEPAVNAARMEHMRALQLLDLSTCAKHLEANRATHFLLLTLDLFSLALSKAILCRVLVLLARTILR